MPPEPHSRFTKTQKQLVLIAILLVGLIVALKTQPSDSLKTPLSSETGELEISALAMQPLQQDREADVDASRFEVTDLRRIPLSVLHNHQLFRRVATVPGESKQRTASISVDIKAVYGDHSEHRTAALIGDQIVHPGHHLRQGLTVTDVSAKGIKVSQ
jgi:hypothetical protein